MPDLRATRRPRTCRGSCPATGMPPSGVAGDRPGRGRRYGVELIAGSVEAIEPGFVVHLAGGRALETRRVLLATGVGDELPDIPGVAERWGRDLLHCPYCHGWEVRDQPIGVLGTHPLSAEHAQLIRQWSSDVVFFAHTAELSSADRAQLDARGIEVVDGEVSRLVIEKDELVGVELADGRIVARTAVFIRPGNLPHADGLLSGLACDLDEAGFPVVDGTGRTSVPGVWAAGNVADPRAQVITEQQAAAIMLKGLTVQYLIRRTYKVKAGDTVLLHAAAGGVGLIASQWLRALGVTVIGTVSTEE